MNNTYFTYATPESVGISSDGIQKLIDTMCMRVPGQETHGFTIIRHKKIVADGNFASYDDRPHVIHSCSKAFTATAVGFAQKEGLLSLDDPVMKYMSEYAPEGEHAPELDRLTIRHLLIMAGGHASNSFIGPHSETPSDKIKRDFMAQKFGREPGTKFAYNNTNSYILAAIIKKLTGLDPVDYLRPRLLDKLGIDPTYERDTDGMFVGYGTMRLRREELARLGQFYMDGCVWEGERLMSAEWADEATRFHVATGAQTSTPDLENAVVKQTEWNQGYAYHMWRGQHNSFRFCGAYGQVCACYPEYDLMLCVNSGHTEVIQDVFDSFYENIFTKLEDKLPEDQTALAALRARCEKLAIPMRYSDPSPIIRTINNRTWQLENCGAIQTAALNFTDDVCHIALNFNNGHSFVFDAGLKTAAYTDCEDTYIVSLQPKDGAVCAASGCWTTLNEFDVTAYMVPTHTMFMLKFRFANEDGGMVCTLTTDMKRAYNFGAKPRIK